MKVEVLKPTVSFLATPGKQISRREALVIVHPFRAILDPMDFWGRAKNGPVMYVGSGISVTVNPNHTVTVTLKDGIKAVKVAVGKTWRDVVAIPYPLAVGVKLKTQKGSLKVPTKYYLKNGKTVGKKYVSVPLQRRIVPGTGGELRILLGKYRNRRAITKKLFIQRARLQNLNFRFKLNNSFKNI